MIHAAIVDDLQRDLDIIKNFLSVYAQENSLPLSITEFQSGEAFLENFCADKYSIVFLDIIMEGLNGMETAKKIRSIDSQAVLVFVTTEAEYAIEGYEADASAFLVKGPALDYPAFARMMDRLKPKLNNHDFLEFKEKGGTLRLPVFSLCYADVIDHKLTLHTEDKEFVLRMPIKAFQESFFGDTRFFECHRGIIVNLDWIQSIEKKVIHLKNGVVLPCSRRRHQDLIEAYSSRNFALLREKF